MAKGVRVRTLKAGVGVDATGPIPKNCNAKNIITNPATKTDKAEMIIMRIGGRSENERFKSNHRGEEALEM